MMGPHAKLPRLDDVARRAQVSPATVSRFFNNPELLAPKTAERIRAAVAETGYVPNLLAGGLASNRSQIAAILVPDIAQSIFNDTIEAIAEALAANGYMPMLEITAPDGSRMNRAIEAALARRAEAIVLTGIVDDEAMRQRLRTRRTTVIETWGLPDDPIDVAVGFSHRAVGAEVARFLLLRGYRRPALAVAEAPRSKRRRDGFLAEWATSGGETPVEIAVPMPSSFAQARMVFRRLSELKPRPDVVVCGSDWLAQGLIIEAQAAGLRVPDDLAVIGLGNLALAGSMRPTITSVDIDGARIGREAVEVLRKRAAGEPVPQRHIDVGFRIIARESA